MIFFFQKEKDQLETEIVIYMLQGPKHLIRDITHKYHLNIVYFQQNKVLKTLV